MTEPARPYHHGDLRRALVISARALLESDGPQALSLRAVARDAGVSPAAPYHHFRDKNELLDAVADQGFIDLATALEEAGENADDPLAALGCAYVAFAGRYPALYRVMSGSLRQDAAPTGEPSAGWSQVMAAIRRGVAQAGGEGPAIDASALAVLAVLHGLSDMSAFHVLAPVKAALGGQAPFVLAVLGGLRIFAARPAR